MYCLILDLDLQPETVGNLLGGLGKQDLLRISHSSYSSAYIGVVHPPQQIASHTSKHKTYDVLKAIS